MASGAACLRTDHAISGHTSLALYTRLEKEGRLTRPKHWLDFAPFHMAHTPLRMTAAEVQDEVQYAWANAYSPAATRRAIDSIANEPAPYKISHLIARMFFRGIYFPQKGAWAWVKTIMENRAPVFHVIRESFTNWRGRTATAGDLDFEGRLTPPVPVPEAPADL
jgi:hypothetical protein